MNYLREQLERKASGVIHVSEYQDSEPTLQFKDFIIDKISNQDSDFAELIQQNPNKTFSFGDKFFAPLIDDNILVCIPLDSANIELKLQKILTGDYSNIIASYSEQIPLMEESNYFDISWQLIKNDMGLYDFFRVNMPYGIQKNENGEWAAFNREYKPLGFDTQELVKYEDYPIYSKYERLTEKVLLQLGHGKGPNGGIHRNENGEIYKVFFYNDGTNPKDNPKLWDLYFDKIKTLAKLKKVEKKK